MVFQEFEFKIEKNGNIYLKKDFMKAPNLNPNDILQIKVKKDDQVAYLKKKLSVIDIIDKHIKNDNIHEMTDEEDKILDKELNAAFES